MMPRRRIATAAVLVVVALGVLRLRNLPGPQIKLLLGSTLALGLLLRRMSGSKRGSYITNLSTVGRRVVDGSETTDVEEFDVIIVGGGTAGCVLASRLTEDPSVRVLVLESGGSGRSLLMTRIPAAFPMLFRNKKYVYQLHTEPQNAADGKKKFWPRGKMLGGCSSINAQMAQYGAPGDFDQWANIIGDESWSWKNFRQYFMKFERYVHDPEYPLVDSSLKGAKGPVRIGYFSTASQTSKNFIKSCISLGMSFSPDFNTTGAGTGVNRVRSALTYIDENRERVSAETAYLTKDVLARPNLSVALHAQVTRVLFKKVGDETRAIGVEFANVKGGPRYQARSKKEVIVSAGAVHSPHILLLSGVGPARDLQKHGIPVINDLPGVGAHLVDHPVVDLHFKDKTNTSPIFLRPHNLWEVFQVLGSVIQYFTTKRGPLVINTGEATAFCRTDDPVLFPPTEFPAQLKDSTSASGSADLELFTTPFAYRDHGDYVFPVHTYGLHCTLLRPISTGNLRLRSSNPWEDPILDPKYLEAPEDIEKLKRGIKLLLKISQTEPLASLLDQDDKNPALDHQMHLMDDQELENVIKTRVETLYHPASTCRMAPLKEGGVVDSQLRVYGIHGLRVCDASIFSEIVSGHTTGAVMAIAEKLSDVIKAGAKASNT